MNYTFDERVKNILFKNGWSPERQINIEKYISVLNDNGYSINQHARKFLINLGGLCVKHEAYSNTEETDISEFNPIKPVGWLDPRWVEEYYQKLAKISLCLVGVGFSEHMVFLVSEKGALYGGYDDYFCLIGNSIEEGLLNLFYGHKFISIE